VPRHNRIWALVAAVGVGIVLLQQAVVSFPLRPRQGAGFVVLLLAVIAVALTFRWLLPSALPTLRRCPELLVPLGLLVFAEAVVGWLLLLPALAAILAPSKPVQILSLSFTLSGALFLSIFVRVLYATWMTTLVIDVVREDRADLGRSFARCWRWFGRVLALEVIGWSVVFLGLLLVIALTASVVPIAMLLIGAGSLLWNLATAALLPTALVQESSRFWPALQKGIRLSWSPLGRWWKLVVVQMLLLGWVTFLSLSYTEVHPGSTTTRSTTNWSVNGFWTGGYENECRWYTKLQEALEAPGVAIVATLLGLVFGLLALGIKLVIAADVGRLLGEPWGAPREAPPSPPLPATSPPSSLLPATPPEKGDDRVQAPGPGF
jgi:hypothetical protein